jgi:hypothetical protein
MRSTEVGWAGEQWSRTARVGSPRSNLIIRQILSRCSSVFGNWQQQDYSNRRARKKEMWKSKEKAKNQNEETEKMIMIPGSQLSMLEYIDRAPKQVNPFRSKRIHSNTHSRTWTRRQDPARVLPPSRTQILTTWSKHRHECHR